ncbi:hypothetical protein WEI85_16680 [Actinomycetes bacterium KLBMP 9797]
MSAATLALSTPRSARPAGDPRRAMLALARVEAVRLLRHPVTVAGLVLVLGSWLYPWLTGGANRYPILHDQDWSGQFLAMLGWGGAAMVAANLGVLRAHRHGTAAVFDVLNLRQHWRTGGFLLALVPLAALAAGLAAARIGLLAALPGAAGAPSPFEVAAYPAVVLLLGAAGVLLGRLVRAVFVAPLAVFALFIATFASALPGVPAARWLRWLLPVAYEEPPMPLPADLMTRPAGRHLAYLLALAIVVGVAALLAAGARDRRLAAAGAAGLAVAVLAGSAQFLPAGDQVRAARVAAIEHPHQMQTCREIEQVTYCAFDEFAPWIDGWDAVVRGVLRPVPDQEAARPLAVRQRISLDDRLDDGGYTWGPEDTRAQVDAWRAVDAAGGTPNAVTVGTRWGDGRSQVGLAGLVAYEVIARAGTPVVGSLCGARAVLVGWLAGQATPATAAGLREVDASSWGGVGLGDMLTAVAVTVPDREMAVVLELLRRPAGEVAGLVERHWAELSAAGTPTERAGEIFGAPVAPLTPDEEQRICEA